MIDIGKVRLWSVFFARTKEITTLPFPNMLVMEKEEKGYQMPYYSTKANIPEELGGQITVTIRGSGCLQVGKKEYTLKGGTAFIYRDCDPSVRYFTAKNSTEPWQFIWINFTGLPAAQWIESINTHYGYFFDLCNNNALTLRLLEFQQYAGTTMLMSPFNGAALMLELLNLLCSEIEQKQKYSPKDLLISGIENDLVNSFDERISIEHLAKKFRVSREYLSRVFREKNGMTLSEYLKKHRMKKALKLLMGSNLSCKEIAQHCNFGDYSTFFRSFVREYRQPPEQFRKK